MADKFYDRMPNVNEKLNEMDRAFTAGPFNALPLTGGTLTGQLTAPTIKSLRTAESVFVIGGDKGGWWMVAKVNPQNIATEAVIRISGTTPFFARDASGNAMQTVISLRCDADGVVRGHFYSIGASPSDTCIAVSVDVDGRVFAQLYALSTLSIYTDSTMSIPQEVEYYPGGPPASAHSIPPVFGLKLGNENTFNVTPGAVLANASITAGAIGPLQDNTYDIGRASVAYRTIYARTGTINTSDARMKRDFRDLNAAEIAAAKDLVRAIGIYRWRDAVDCKGADAREHVGPTVQCAVEIMQAHGLDPFNYGFICHDTWDQQTIEHPAIEARPAIPATEAVPEVLNSFGDVITPAVLASAGVSAVEARAAYTEVTLEAGDRYAFRYDELAMFIAAGQEARLAALEAA
ncbi:tail fiber domain-containing protein [Janthinobacterium lividum]|uniref:tail fiber domain-containing protein n=1 Tax=Janthinobacterium lividum TaxID=29581 RepID=UPI00140889AE|nr:tail fiber domain-containing protein [Janthinobacterium lividum]NHQ93295.1 tail fiber domain-containing protein [Janthinobacterium lividum]